MQLINAKAQMINANTKIQPEPIYFKCSNYEHYKNKIKWLLRIMNTLSIFSQKIVKKFSDTHVLYTCVFENININKGIICKN